MKPLLPAISTYLNPRAKQRSRCCHMRPDAKKTAQVSYPMYSSTPPNSHQPPRGFCTEISNWPTALPISLKYAFLDAFRHSHSFLEHSSNVNSMLQRWIAAASTLPYTDDVCEGVVDTLLRMSFQDELRQHIPAEAWDWLKKRPVLGPNCQGLKYGASLDAFQTVRKTGNLELITSYLFVVWSKWSWSYPDGCTAVLEFIRSGLRGVEGMGYRADLIKRLNAVLSQMDSDPSPPPEAADNASWYAQFRTALEEGNKGARR